MRPPILTTCERRGERLSASRRRLGGSAMATVYLVTAGSGDTYHIERVYLDRDQADQFAQDYNGMAPNEPVHVEEWESGAPPGAMTAPPVTNSAYVLCVAGSGRPKVPSGLRAANETPFRGSPLPP